jgi:cytoskeleton protein RodZ
MNTTAITDNVDTSVPEEMPGAQLASVRVEKGYTLEYVAGKLHLRVRVIELLEADAYNHMPEPVFIKGYLRAYAKLLDVPHQPLLDLFNRHHQSERKLEKAALWQSRRETHKAEHAVRWLTSIFALVVLVAVAIWWQSNKGNEHLFSANFSNIEPEHNQSETEIRLTDLSKMRSLLSSTGQEALMEKQGG